MQRRSDKAGVAYDPSVGRRWAAANGSPSLSGRGWGRVVSPNRDCAGAAESARRDATRSASLWSPLEGGTVRAREGGTVRACRHDGGAPRCGPEARAPRPAFSLAEMMIALAILAMGLLVIGAALPIGIRYTRTSVNIATGEAAAEYALDLIEQSVCIPRRIWDPNVGAGNQNGETGIFVPRLPGTGVNDPNTWVFDPNY